jgi:hypothetical protein
MGSSSMIDIVCATIVGALLMLNLSRLYIGTAERSSQFTMETIVQKNLVEFFTQIEADFMKMGYMKGQENIPFPGQILQVADTNRIVFLADLDDSGTADKVEYYLGLKDSLSSSPNPYDRPFYRKINDIGPKIGSYGVTQMRFEYYDFSGAKLTTPVSNLGNIRTISITVAVESPYLSDSNFPNYNAKAFWKQMHLAIPNLRYK